MSARLTALQDRLALYLEAEIKILEGNQSWSAPNGMTYTRGNLFALQQQIEKLEAEIAILSPTTSANYNAQSFVFGGR